MIVVEIVRRWGKHIIEEVVRNFVNPWDGMRDGVIYYLGGIKRKQKGV